VDLPGITEIADARRAAWRDGDAWLAGGTWLFSEPQPGVTRLLDLRAFGWPAIAARPDGLEIAATCTLAELAALRARWRAAPLLGQCCAALLGSFKVANVATVGGNLCLALPAGPMISLAVALDGTCTIWDADRSERRLSAVEFVTGPGRCALAPGELLRAVRLPAAALDCVTAFRQLSLSAHGRSGALVIGRRHVSPAAVTPAAGSPTTGSPTTGQETVITVTAATTRPVRLGFPGLPSPGDALAALDAAGPCWHDDAHGSPRWRAAVTRQLVLEVRDELADGQAPGGDR
jgi:hypothetical protein